MVRYAVFSGVLFAVCLPLVGQNAPPRPTSAVNLSRLPLVFEENLGQGGEDTPFLARGQGFRLQLQPTGAILDLHDTRIRFHWNTAATPKLHGVSPTGGASNYYIGEDSGKWVTRARHYRRVRYEGVYPGIDLVFYGNQRQTECDWVVDPYADPGQIRFSIDSEATAELTEDGELKIGDFLFGAPNIYQPSGKGRIRVSGRYLLNEREVSFEVGAYDRSQTLVIDPTLVVTYVGGRDTDIPAAMAVDSTGFLYVTGYTMSGNFPVTATPYKGTLVSGDADAFVMKLNPAGSQIMYATFLGGVVPQGSFTSGAYTDYGRAIAVDSTNAVYITGSTMGRFPVTGSAFSQFLSNAPAIFATKLDPAGGTLVYSTYIDGAGVGQAIGVDAGFNAYIAGYTYSATLTTTNPVLQKNYGGATDGFIVKLNSGGSAEVYSTFLGGSAEDQITGLRVDGSGNAYVSGFTSSSDFPTTAGAFRTAYAGSTDAFVAKIAPNGNALTYSTFLGGSNLDRAYALDINSGGEVFVAGQTNSPSFPTTTGAFRTAHGGGGADAFVARLNAAGSNLIYSTFLGGSGACSVTDPFRAYTCDSAYGIAVNSINEAYVVGLAGAGFPLAGAQQSTPGGNGDAFVALLDASGAYLLHSTYVGGGGSDVATAVINSNASGPVLSGFTSSSDLPVTAGALQSTNAGGLFDGFLTRLAVCSVTTGSGSFFPNTAGSYSVGVVAASGCSWYATADQSWVSFSSNAGAGSASMSFTISANNGPQRVAHINVMGQIYTITQVAGCYVQLGISSSWFPQGGVTNLSLPLFSNCTWTVSSQQSWITLAPASGSGSATIIYSVAANSTGAARTGAIDSTTPSAAGNSFTINQLGGPGNISSCTFSLSSLSESFGKDGGSGSVLVTTQSGCDWTVSNPNSWITLTGGSAGSGAGVIGYTVQRNTTGMMRSGFVTFGSQTFTIFQSGT